MVEGLFSLLFTGRVVLINMLGRKLTDGFGASLLLLELSCFKAEIHGHFNMIILTYHLLKLTDVFEIHVHFKMII